MSVTVYSIVDNRYADVLAEYHDDDHLVKFEELLEAAVDLDKIPDEYLICASYDAGLQVTQYTLCGHGAVQQCQALWIFHIRQRE